MNDQEICFAWAFVVAFGICLPVAVWALFFDGDVGTASSIIAWTTIGGSLGFGTGLAGFRALGKKYKGET